MVGTFYYDKEDDEFPTCASCHVMTDWGGCTNVDCPDCDLTEEAKGLLESQEGRRGTQMTPPKLSERIRELREIAKKATPGPMDSVLSLGGQALRSTEFGR